MGFYTPQTDGSNDEVGKGDHGGEGVVYRGGVEGHRWAVLLGGYRTAGGINAGGNGRCGRTEGRRGGGRRGRWPTGGALQSLRNEEEGMSTANSNVWGEGGQWAAELRRTRAGAGDGANTGRSR
jgi:hypothetical protein